MVTIEVCCGSVEDVQIAAQFPIDRIELNAAINVGGLTPTLSTLKHSLAITDIPIICMVRVRSGSSTYNESEYQVMFDDAKLLLENGADGIAFGFVDEKGHLEIDRTKEMIDLAHSYGKEAVMHRAFDRVVDPLKTLATLHELGLDRILTSGQEEFAPQGAAFIKELHQQNQVEILAGGGLTPENLEEFLKVSEVKHFHGTFSDKLPPTKSLTNTPYDEDVIPISRASAEKLKQVMTIIKR